jgi:acyl carrier protein
VNDQEFLEAFADTIGASRDELAMNTRLKTLEIWDSVAYLSVMVLLDEKLGVALGPDELLGAETPEEILIAVRAAK